MPASTAAWTGNRERRPLTCPQVPWSPANQLTVSRPTVGQYTVVVVVLAVVLAVIVLVASGAGLWVGLGVHTPPPVRVNECVI